MNYELRLKVPQSWESLTQGQLRQVFRAMAVNNTLHTAWSGVAVHCILRWNSLRAVTPYSGGWLLAPVSRRSWRRRKNKPPREMYITASQLTDLAYCMEWVRDIPAGPVRLNKIDGAKAVPADLSDRITFGGWLACENLWQGYQATQDPELIRQMAEILYEKEGIRLAPHETISIFYWWASVKQVMSARFPNFFKPAPEGDSPEIEIEKSMNAQIRALTKGDITKEEQILSMSPHRALTELDALAREYDELRRKYPSNS